MSNRILQALMQLFAIIARPESSLAERIRVVRNFLQNQLNRAGVAEYIAIFENYWYIHQDTPKENKKRQKRLTSSSVRVLKICTEINEELTQKQKFIVLILLLEFINSEKDITTQELEFVATVADTFHITPHDFDLLKTFVIDPFYAIPFDENTLFISHEKDPLYQKHIDPGFFIGQIRVQRISTADLYIMRYHGSSELMLNSLPIQQNKVYVLSNGSSIKSPLTRSVYISDIIRIFNRDKVRDHIVLECESIDYTFKNGQQGLHSISFTEESGKLIGIMGSSGTGKTTLVNLLNGTLKPSGGRVLINGVDLHQEKGKVEGLIGYVAQDDLLIEELTVFENLYFNARLCFKALTKFQLIRLVAKTLVSLGLFEIKDMKVGSLLDKQLSGGQRKRLNIALELIREPAILFLDEPTSGLSSRDSEHIMDLLKELALKGKMVFVVIHQPSSEIFKMLDKLILLDQGGYLIYQGDPVDSIIYFKSQIQQADWADGECRVCGNVNPEQVFNIVEANVVDEFGKITRMRKNTPKEWAEAFNKYRGSRIQATEYPRMLPQSLLNLPGWFRQFSTYFKRDILSKLYNRNYVLINLIEAPLLAFILSFLIKYHDVSADTGYLFRESNNLPVYIFMSVIVAIFVGLTVGAPEILKDLKMLSRERFLNLSRSGYLWAKISILFGISALQSLLYVLVGNTIFEIKGMYLEYWLLLFSTWCAANLLGLVISDSFKQTVTVYILIPFLIIPQIILSGVIVRFDELNPLVASPDRVPWYGEIMASRWAFEALAVNQFKNNAYQKDLFEIEMEMSRNDFKKNYWIKELENQLQSVRLNKNKAPHNSREGIRLIKTELSTEASTNGRFQKYLSEKYPDLTQPSEDISGEYLKKIERSLQFLENYYQKKYNRSSQVRDAYITDYQNKNGKETFLALRDKHHNNRLERFVRNTEELERIIVYNGRLVQKSDPIYKLPESSFIKAHFYAPVKGFLVYHVDTFWMNVVVLWLMTFATYVVLYTRTLYKLLNLRLGSLKHAFKKGNKKTGKPSGIPVAE